MTTKIITPQEVTSEMLVAGVESNETETNWPVRYQLVNGEIRHSVKFSGKWECVSITATIEDFREWMAGNSDDDTIWTTPIQETA